MSAVNIFETPDRAIIFTDASVYDGNGILLDLMNKCHVTAEGGLAVTGRGNAIFPIVVAKHLSKAAFSIDLIADSGGEFLEALHAGLEGVMIEHAGKALNNIWIVGWSVSAGKPKIAQWTNCPPSGVPRFSMVDVVMAPNLSADGYARVRRANVGSSQATVDYGRLGLDIMKSQRLDAGTAEFGAEGKFLVGGRILRTDVTKDGIVQKVVHEWPEDRIGERIRPAPDLGPAAVPNVTPLVGLNRAERRRAEKVAKRNGRAA